MQLVNIVTNDNLIGFDFFEKERSDFYIRFGGVSTVPTPGYNLDDEENEFPICEFEIQLKDNFFSEKRQYSQLMDVLGEVGGFMEFMSSFLGVICSFIVDILYENSITNDLFSFNLNKKIINIKNDDKASKYKNVNNIYTIEDDNQNEESMGQINLNFKNSKKRRKIGRDNFSNLTNNCISKTNLKYKQKIVIEDVSKTSENKDKNDKNKNIPRNVNNNEKKIVSFNSNKMNTKNKSNNDNNNNDIINSIDLNIFCVHFGFCFVRKKKNLNMNIKRTLFKCLMIVCIH